jgi:hypothetical protein
VIRSEGQFEADTVACLREGAAAGQKLFRFMPAAVIAGRGPVYEEMAVIYADPAQQFLGGGPLRAEAMLEMFAEQTAIARRDGFTGIRLVADMDWLLGHPPTPQQVAAFELVLDKAVAELGATVVCAYRPDSFGPAVTEAAAVHPQHAGSTPIGTQFRIWYGGDGRWQLSGEVDLVGIESFERALRVAAKTGPVHAVGCAGVRFMSAAGVAALSRLAMTPQPHPMVIEDAAGVIRGCWQALGLEYRQHYVRFGHTAAGGTTEDAVYSEQGQAA